MKPSNKSVWTLIYGTAPLVHAVPDDTYAGMWRLRWPNGQFSDLGNLSRIKDAGHALCEPGRDSKSLRWRKTASDSLSRVRTRIKNVGPVSRKEAA